MVDNEVATTFVGNRTCTSTDLRRIGCSAGVFLLLGLVVVDEELKGREHFSDFDLEHLKGTLHNVKFRQGTSGISADDLVVDTA